MTLATILYPAPTAQGWEEWLHAHVRHHEAMIEALRDTRGVTLSFDSPLYPLNMDSGDSVKVWNRAHLNIHNAMNELLGIPGQDISTPDFKDQKALDGWLYVHFSMHQNVAQLCGQPV